MTQYYIQSQLAIPHRGLNKKRKINKKINKISTDKVFICEYVVDEYDIFDRR